MSNKQMSFSFTKKIILLVISFSFIVSCGSEDGQVNIPSNVLNEEKFTKLLVDFALAESISNINVKNIPSDKSDSVYAFDPLKENNISRPEYDSSLAFYSKHPSLYKKIYENVLVVLSKMQIKKDSAKVDQASK
ncbi:MAG: DUF4296 domain-containing protein [Bacteroidia bacterium]